MTVRAQCGDARRSQRHALLVGFDFSGDSDIHAMVACSSSRARIDDTVRAEPLAIAARATANAIDARQSRVTRVIDAARGCELELDKTRAAALHEHWM